MSSALEKALIVLETVTAQLRATSSIDVALMSELPRQTAHRVLQQLEGLELVQREPGSERFAIGPRLRRLSLAALSTFQQTQVTHDILAALAGEIRETCNIGMLDGHQVIYLDRVECDWPLKVQLEPGSHVPIYCTALGKLLLAFAESEHRVHLLERVKLTRYTDTTITDRRALSLALEEIREKGYSVNHGEDAVGLIAMAVPIRDPNGAVVAGLATHAPEARMNLRRLTGWKERMDVAAQEIADALFAPGDGGSDGTAMRQNVTVDVAASRSRSANE